MHGAAPPAISFIVFRIQIEFAIHLAYSSREISGESIKKRKTPLVALFSDDDPFVPLENVDIFKKKLGAETIVEHGQGHYNHAQAPSVLKELLKMLHLH